MIERSQKTLNTLNLYVNVFNILTESILSGNYHLLNLNENNLNTIFSEVAVLHPLKDNVYYLIPEIIEDLFPIWEREKIAEWFQIQCSEVLTLS